MYLYGRHSFVSLPSCLTPPLLLRRVTCGTGTMMLCAPALVTVGIWCDRSTFGGSEESPIWGPEKPFMA